MPVSILILTLNEETNIGACLDALAGFDDIVVFDSLSKDKTKDIALAKGARIVERPFDNWASHQNWAMASIAFTSSCGSTGLKRQWRRGSRSMEAKGDAASMRQAKMWR